jgi:chemotaxis signal transduction protein
MSERLTSRVEKLRTDFDAAFAAPHRAENVARRELVVVRVSSIKVGLWLLDVASLHRDASVVRLPTESSAFSGVTNLEGHLTSVFDLGVLLGAQAKARPVVRRCWLARMKDPRVALSFDSLVQQIGVPGTSTSSTDAAAELAPGVHVDSLGTLRLLDTTILARVLGTGRREHAGGSV